MISGRQYLADRQRESRQDSARSEAPIAHGNTLHGNREVPRLSPVGSGVRIGKFKDVRR